MEFQCKRNRVIQINIQNNLDYTMITEKNIFKREEVDHVLSQFQKSTDITASKLIYEKIKRPCLEEMMNLVFGYKKKNDIKHQRTVSSIINMLKSGGGFAQFIADHPQFNKELIFGFLQQEIVSQNILSVFGDIFINLARANPVKVLQIIKNEYVQNILITNLKKSHIISIIYTAIFCANKTQSNQFKNFIHSVLKVLLNSPFENRQGQNIFSNCICSAGDSCVTNQEQYTEPKKIFRKSSLQIEEKLDNTFHFCKKGCLNKQHIFFDQKDHHYYEETIEATTNLCDMLQQISANIEGLYIGNVQILINVILQNHYIKELFAFLLLNEKSTRINKQELSAQILRLLFQISTISRAFTQNVNATTIKSISSDNKIQPSSFKKERRKSIEVLLQVCQLEQQKKKQTQLKKDLYSEETVHVKMLQIFQQISHYLKLFFLEYQQMRPLKRYCNFSSGGNIEKVGFPKYWVLKIYYELLSVIKGSNHQIQTKYNLKKAMPVLLQLIKQVMSSNKWNNIVQKLISRIIKLYIKVCYSLFYHEAVNIDKPDEGFLGFLIENFRNKYFVFLDTMKFTSQGNRHILFALSREISAELHSNRDLFWLFNKFPQWKLFMENDLQNYQHSITNQRYCEAALLQLELSKSKSQIGRQPSQVLDYGESVEEIIDFYRDNLLWEKKYQGSWRLKTKNQIQTLSTTTHQSLNISKSVDLIKEI